MLPDWLPWLLQVADSAFPSGAYAHSLGLEELVQGGVVSSPDTLETFLKQQITPALLAFDVPVLAAAHGMASGENLIGLRALDEELDAWKIAAELRSASRQIGSRRLALIRQLDDTPWSGKYAEMQAPCHQVVICALELRGLPLAAAACAFSQQTIAGYAMAAMKLLPMGQDRCQAIVRRTMLTIIPKLTSACAVPLEEAGWFNPLLEIASMRHARATERLFIS
jgi:urease accessory protein